VIRASRALGATNGAAVLSADYLLVLEPYPGGVGRLGEVIHDQVDSLIAAILPTTPPCSRKWRVDNMVGLAIMARRGRMS
jgi:hypothetical protein